MLFGLVGLTLMKLSAWLPVVALTLSTGSRQLSGLNSWKDFVARCGARMHLRGDSDTLISAVRASSCPWKMNVTAVRSAKTTASIVRRRRVFIRVLGKEDGWNWQVTPIVEGFLKGCRGLFCNPVY